MSVVDIPWSPAEFDLLVQLWPTHSAGQIARKLKNRSRSAVLGKVFRKKLPKKGKDKTWLTRRWKQNEQAAREIERQQKALPAVSAQRLRDSGRWAKYG